MVSDNWLLLRAKRAATQFRYVSWPLLVFVASLLCVLASWIFLPGGLWSGGGTDYRAFYEPVARSILDGHGITLPDGSPAMRYPPGLPMLLAAVFGVSHVSGIPESAMLSIFILLCVALSSVLIYWLSSSVWGPKLGLLSSIAFTTYPFFLGITKEPTSEIPFTAVFVATICLLWRGLLRVKTSWPEYFAVGLLAGFAMLIRPSALGLGVVLVLFVWFVTRRSTAPRKRLLFVSALLLGNLLAVLPWEAHVYTRTGTIIPLSTGGAVSTRDGLTFAVNGNKSYRQEIAVPEEVAILQRDLLANYDKMSSVSGTAFILLEELRTRPVVVLELFAIKAARSWFGTDSGRYESVILVIQGLYVLLALAGSIGAWRHGGTTRLLVILVWVLVLYLWIMTILVLSILRYMVPATALLFSVLPSLVAKQGRSLLPIASRPQRLETLPDL